jgi:hemolysin activation/secretion protein
MCVVLALAMLPGALGAQVLPPPPVDTDPARQLFAQARLFVKGYRFEGNAAFSDAELAKLTEPYSQRELGTDELEQARRAITLHYVRNGYINSGAVIPDQNPADGIIIIRIVEGQLTEIELHGNKWLRSGYIRSRLERWSQTPLNLTELQEGLQLLRQNPNVRQINGELKPGSSPGQSILDVKVEDQQPFRLGMQFDNQRPPSVGAEQFSLLASDLNLTGNSDPLQFRYGIVNASADGLELSGADNLEGSYALPLNRLDTSIGLHGSRLNTSIIEDPLLPLAITSLTKSFGLVLRQPVYQRPSQEVAVSVGFDRSDNQSWLLGQPFNVSPGAVDGQMVVSVLRVSQEWLQRGPKHVLALRSTFNLGLDVWDATDDGIPGDPDAAFFSWLGQAQYVRRLFNTQNQVILRLTGQWTSDRLLALEQISVGGYNSVRGYIENQLVRDRGLISSIEFRVPVLFDKSGAGMLHLAPFFDFGGGWNNEGSPSPTTICSTGLGVLFTTGKHFSAEIYWGHRFQDVDIPDNAGLQGHGVGVKINMSAF